MESYRSALELEEKIARERGTLDDLRELSVSYYNIAWLYENQTRYNFMFEGENWEQSQYENALKMYRKSLELREKITRGQGMLDDLRELSFIVNDKINFT